MNSEDAHTDVIVIGAGLAGLAAARDLSRAGFSVRVLEKSRGVSGRAATRRLELTHEEAGKTHLDDVIRVDHGAQFFTVRGQRLGSMLPDLIENGTVHEWTRGFSRLRSSGQIELRPPGHPRYVCRDGMSALGKAFAQGLSADDEPLEVLTHALVSALWPSNFGWSVVLETGETHHAMALVVTAPAPQALALTKSNLPDDLVSKLASVQFDPCWAVVVALEEDPMVDWAALEVDHPVLSWVSLDHTKRPPGAPPTLVLHANGAWSRTHLEARPDAIVTPMLAAARETLGPWASRARIVSAQRWRYALPTVVHPDPYLAYGTLVFAGDWCGGPRIEGAIESGWAAAAYLRDHRLIPVDQNAAAVMARKLD